MIKWKVILTLLIALSCSVALTACGRSAKAKAALEKKVQELETTLQISRTERDGLKAEMTKLSDLLKIAESQIASVTRQCDNLQQRVKELTDAADRSRSHIDELLQSKEQAQQRADAISQERDQLQQEVQALSKSDAELQQNLAELIQSQQELQQRVSTLTQSRDQLKDRLDKAINARDELQKQLGMFTQGQAELEQSIRELSNRWGTALAGMKNIQVKIRLLPVPEFVASSD